MTQPNQPNQSELEKQINNIMFNEMGATGWNGSTKAIVYLNARNALTAYITANYTANSEVEQLKSRIAWLEGKIEGLSNDNLTPHLTPHLTPKKLPRFEP